MGRNVDWLGVVARLGVPAAIAVFLVWFLSQDVKTSLVTITRTLDAHVADMKSEQQRTRYLLKAICDNSAHNDRELAACAEAVR